MHVVMWLYVCVGGCGCYGGVGVGVCVGWLEVGLCSPPVGRGLGR